MRPFVELAVVVVVTAVAAHLGFQLTRGATAGFWFIIAVPDVVLAVYAGARLAGDGELSRLLKPAGGDLTRGFLSAAVLYAMALAFTHYVLPAGSPREAWLVRLYLQFGDPHDLGAYKGVLAVGLLAITFCEEIIWRGLVMAALAEITSVRVAWIYSAILYSVAHAPTIFALSVSSVGPNPLICIAALAAGLIWGGMTYSFQRLPPAILSHALFDWCVIVLFRLWGPPV